MKIIDLEQGSPEWHAWRATKATASNSAVIMNCAPSYYSVRSWADLRIQEAGLGAEPDQRTKEAWAHGREREAAARKWLEANAEADCPPVCIEAAESPFAASLDGFSPNQIMLAAEIKCPVSGHRSKMYRQLSEWFAGQENDERKAVPDHVWWQIVHQAFCLDAERGMLAYVVYIDDENAHRLDIPIERLREDWPSLRAEWLRYLAGEDQFPAENADDFSNLAATWLKFNSDVVEATTNRNDIRDKLIAIVPNGQNKMAGFGVSVSKSARKGSVDWKKVAAELGVDDTLAEKHRKPDSETWTVRAKT